MKSSVQSIMTNTDTPERTPTVWLTNMGGHDYSKAKRFGNLVPFTIGNVNPFNFDRIMATVGPKLDLANEDDYLLISGSPIICSVIIAMWLRRFGRVRVLQWSTRKEDYVPGLLTANAVERNALSGTQITW